RLLARGAADEHGREDAAEDLGGSASHRIGVRVRDGAHRVRRRLGVLTLPPTRARPVAARRGGPAPALTALSRGARPARRRGRRTALAAPGSSPRSVPGVPPG